MKLISTDGIQVVDDGTFDAVALMREYFLGGEGSLLDVDEAHYLCDLSDVCRKMRNWVSQMPRVHPFYAVKCNDDVTILRLLAALGANFDCASRGEIRKVLDLGVSPDKIIFANPCKPSSHIKFAATENVAVMTFDSVIELQKVKQFYPHAQMVLRFRCDAKKAQCPLGDKFGCDPKKDAPRLLQEAKNLNMDVIGVSFHVGSGCGDAPVFRKAISTARDLFDYGTTLGFNMQLLDLGGGYPGDKGTDISEIAKIVNRALEDYFPQPEIKVIAEPGRYFVSSAYTLATTIHSKNELLDTDGNVEHVKYYLNDGVYGSFNSLLYDHQLPNGRVLLPEEEKMVIEGGEQQQQLQNASLWGPTCDALDKIQDNVRIPSMAIGDVIYFENMGAYTLPVASPFNGFPLPRVSYFVGNSDWTGVSMFF